MSNDTFTQVTTYLEEKFGIVIDWSQENIIPYIKELCAKIVKYNITINIIGAVISFAFMLISGFLLGYIIKQYCYLSKAEDLEPLKHTSPLFNVRCSCFELNFAGCGVLLVSIVLALLSASVFIKCLGLKPLVEPVDTGLFHLVGSTHCQILTICKYFLKSPKTY